MKSKTVKKPICPKCESSQSYFRQEAKENVCRVCGNIFKEKENAKKN